MNTFLPQDYVKPASNNRYYKFITGENKIRILSDAITGWVDWMDNEDGSRKPVRTKEMPKKLFNPKKPAKHFWAFVVWDYADNAIKILEITQSSIQDGIYGLHSDANWGDPKSYDLNINKVGEKLESKYTVIPAPHMEVAPGIKEEFANNPIDLNKLYTGEDPFEAGNSETVPPPVDAEGFPN